MHYENITAWELSKMDWKKVIAKTTGSWDEEKNWIVIEWEITFQHWNIYILHNNMNANGSRPNDMKWYLCSRIIWYTFTTVEKYKWSKNFIQWLETIDFVEWDGVYVSDVSIEHAINEKQTRAYIYTKESWMYITQYTSDYVSNSDTWFNWYKFIVKVPKEEVVEMTMEQVNKALGKKIKIIE